MFRLCNFVFSIINVVIMAVGLGTLGVSVYFFLNGEPNSVCQKSLEIPLLMMGLFLVVVSFLGLMGSCCHFPFLIWIYSFVAFLLILGLIVFTLFAFVVTNNGAGRVLSDIKFKEYRLGDYSNWLRNHFVNDKNWDAIKDCLTEIHVCESLYVHEHQVVADFNKKELTPIQSGCCKPPTYCGLVFKNATFWEMPKSGPQVKDPDCTTWRNDQSLLCYDCNSCKAGVLANIRNNWRNLAIINVCILIFIITIYSISCCARRSLHSRPPKYHQTLNTQ